MRLGEEVCHNVVSGATQLNLTASPCPANGCVFIVCAFHPSLSSLNISPQQELTTRDEYLATRFTKLSASQHDLTPLTPSEVSRAEASMVALLRVAQASRCVFSNPN